MKKSTKILEHKDNEKIKRYEAVFRLKAKEEKNKNHDNV